MGVGCREMRIVLSDRWLYIHDLVLHVAGWAGFLIEHTPAIYIFMCYGVGWHVCGVARICHGCKRYFLAQTDFFFFGTSLPYPSHLDYQIVSSPTQ